MPKKKSRRSDYASRLAARRLDALNAYCQAVGGPKKEDARIRRMARDAGVQERTMRTYLTGRQDMGRKACEALEAKLREAGHTIAEFATDPHACSQGVWIFANPKRKEPFMPQSQREERARQVMAILTGIVSDLSGDTSSEEAILRAIAQITELNYNSVVTVARSCSYFGPERMEKLRTKLAHVKSDRDIALLGQDPRSEPATNGDDDTGDGDADDDESTETPASAIRQFAAVLAEVGPNDVLVVTGDGSHQLFRQDESVVIVVRAGAVPTAHTIPAGCKAETAVVMQSADGKGVVSVPFSPTPS